MPNSTSKYPQEIVKQAEELIEKHQDTSFPELPLTRRTTINAAIVSCEFAMGFLGVSDELTELKQIKSYLEELL